MAHSSCMKMEWHSPGINGKGLLCMCVWRTLCMRTNGNIDNRTSPFGRHSISMIKKFSRNIPFLVRSFVRYYTRIRWRKLSNLFAGCPLSRRSEIQRTKRMHTFYLSTSIFWMEPGDLHSLTFHPFFFVGDNYRCPVNILNWFIAWPTVNFYNHLLLLSTVV